MHDNGRRKSGDTSTSPKPAGSAAEGFGLLVGTSWPMRSLYQTLATVGPSNASVLLVGESGTGKEVVARTLHELSDRRSQRFVALNCAAVPETLIESELFGHEKGAFTGATAQKPGCFELAHGGTLFLDELSAMPLSSQVKLLRVLEERSFRRLRGTREIEVDVRIVAATNQPPEALVQNERLRSDLLFRLNVFTLRLPPLRERLDDIPLLVHHFLEKLGSANDKKLHGVEPEVFEALRNHHWPGNIRELRNVIERGIIVEKGPRVTVSSLPPSVRAPTGNRTKTNGALEAPSRGREPIAAVGMTVDEATRRLILLTLEATGYNRNRAAAMLGISSKTIYNKLKRWEVIPEHGPVKNAGVWTGSLEESRAHPVRQG